MEEETIFNNANPSDGQNNEPPSPPVSQQQPRAPLPPPPPVQPQPSIQPPPSAQLGTPPPPPPPPGYVDHGDGPRFKKILVIVGAVIAVLFLLILVAMLILPRLNKPPQENVTLTYWGLWEDPSVMRASIDEFEKENPMIKVNYEKQDIKEYRDKLSFRIPNGNGPDIFRFHNTWLPMLSDHLLPLPEETIKKEEFKSDYYEVIQDDLVKGGAIYGIPLEVDTLAMFVNTSLVDEGSVPKSWQEFIEKSQSITTRSDDGKIDIAGAAIGTYENIANSPDLISLLFAQNGVNLDDITKSEPKVNDALLFYTNFALVEDNVWDQTLEPSLMYFSKGKVGMVFGYSRDLLTIKALSPELPVKVFPVPQLVQEKGVNIASYWVEGVSSKSKYQKEALLFMEFLARKETQQKLYLEALKNRDFGEPYSQISLADSLSDSIIYPHVVQARNAVSTPFVDGTKDNGLNEKMNSYLKDAVNSILSNTSIDAATKSLFEGYLQIKTEYEG